MTKHAARDHSRRPNAGLSPRDLAVRRPSCPSLRRWLIAVRRGWRADERVSGPSLASRAEHSSWLTPTKCPRQRLHLARGGSGAGTGAGRARERRFQAGVGAVSKTEGRRFERCRPCPLVASKDLQNCCFIKHDVVVPSGRTVTHGDAIEGSRCGAAGSRMRRRAREDGAATTVTTVWRDEKPACAPGKAVGRRP